jgi:hypothetical protein
MQRAGPRGTIPPPSQRLRAGRGWPLQVIVGVGVVSAVFFGLRLLRAPGDDAPPLGPDGSAASPRTAAIADKRSGGDTPAPSPSPLPQNLDAFVSRLRRAEVYRVYGDLELPTRIRGLISDLRIVEAAAELDALSRANDRSATAALARLARECAGEDPDTQRSWDLAYADVTKRATEMSPEVRARLQASATERRTRLAGLQQSCARANFDTQAIAQRLSSAAAAGHEASLWQLGTEAGSEEIQRKYWLSAAMLGFLPAQLDLAESLMSDALNGNPRDAGRMTFWLEAAAKHSARGKLMLGECLARGCNGQPPDITTAGRLLRDAVWGGVTNATGPLASLPADDPGTPTDEEMYSLNTFLQRLNDLGCYGDYYPSNALHISDHLHDLGLRLSPSALQEGQRLADAAWREHGAQAQAEWHCD